MACIIFSCHCHHCRLKLVMLTRTVPVLLNYFARFKKYLLTPDQEHLSVFTSMIRNKLPQETYLELAIGHSNMELDVEAIRVLKNAFSYPVVYYWLAYLYQKENSEEKSQNFLYTMRKHD